MENFTNFANNLNTLSSEGIFGWIFELFGHLTKIAAGASDLIGLIA